ncbi:antibiotic biosynthesis monooxygenase [Thermoleophilum album]|jgi:heme-degrading monooxygenase HmoA|uniref:antibiotic biosynthesis monooxygenase family protein n=1 Tax=Thermoleophilum album TaxID=29539 RepID=UPI00237CE284|nr:antibiotic biosynthesis monooxygenase [Thermoleophilum album]WDT93748.1 antibiotic biosynthesis monooxygenase [Thermoleophilum album]
MIVAMNCITVPENQAEEFERRFLQRERLLAQAPGFLRFDLLRRDRPGDYVVLTYWRSESDFRGWVKSDLFKRAHSREAERPLGGHSELRLYEVIDSEAAAGSSFAALSPDDEHALGEALAN